MLEKFTFVGCLACSSAKRRPFVEGCKNGSRCIVKLDIDNSEKVSKDETICSYPRVDDV